MIEAVEVVREKDGSFTHPEWEVLIDSLGDVEITPTNIIQLFEKAHGLKLEGVTFENTVDEDSPAYKEYLEGGKGFASWELAPPSADAVLLSIHDTEDGPVQLWAVPAFDIEAQLMACVDYLERSKAGPMASSHNAEAVQGVERALEALKDRTRERDAGGR